MSERFEPRDSAHGITAQLIFGLLFGNVLAVLAVIPFHPFEPTEQGPLVLVVGVLSLLITGLLFVVSAVRRSGSFWWALAVGLNMLQLTRLIVSVVVIGAWAIQSEFASIVWAFLFVPILGILSAVGIVMTVREIRKGRRRRLSQAA